MMSDCKSIGRAVAKIQELFELERVLDDDEDSLENASYE